MNKRNISKVLAVSVALVLASGGVQAKPATKEQKIGMSTGTATGALIGGPVGAAIGFVVGAIAGTATGEVNGAKKSEQAMEKQLAAAQAELKQLSDAKQLAATQQAEQASIIEQLAQRLHADVLFRSASAELDAGSMEKLTDLGKVIGSYPDLTIEIDGYADPRGKSDSNDELSERRASAVRAALIVGGVSPDRIKLSAHGEKLSTAMKDDLEAYAWERRVSLSVLPSSATSAGSKVAQTK